ncbi:hypothetical protein R4Y59_002718 [Enterococcus faecalis]|nr:hypothetical protein [Enterococcus faecalis]
MFEVAFLVIPLNNLALLIYQKTDKGDIDNEKEVVAKLTDVTARNELNKGGVNQLGRNS